MPKVTFILPGGSRRTLSAPAGTSVMEVATANSVPGIEAECGGSCSCATCHVYVDAAWSARAGPPSEMEEDMLDFAYAVRATSRLSCQIRLDETLDGLVVHVPERQA